MDLPDALATALVKHGLEYRNPRPTQLEERLFYSHPSVEPAVQRAMDLEGLARGRASRPASSSSARTSPGSRRHSGWAPITRNGDRQLSVVRAAPRYSRILRAWCGPHTPAASTEAAGVACRAIDSCVPWSPTSMLARACSRCSTIDRSSSTPIVAVGGLTHTIGVEEPTGTRCR